METDCTSFAKKIAFIVFIFTCKGYDAQGVELKLDRRGRGRGRLKKGVANLAM